MEFTLPRVDVSFYAMQTWKKIFMWSVGLGAGFGIVFVVCAFTLHWWINWPREPKPWDVKSITASYEKVISHVDGNDIASYYTLENHTDNDFRIEANDGIHVAAHLRRSNALSFSNDNMISAEIPVYLPARSRVRFTIYLKYPYPIKEDMKASLDVRHDYETNLAKFVSDELTNINGAVLMVDAKRIQINMPDGWTPRAKQPLRVKIPITTK